MTRNINQRVDELEVQMKLVNRTADLTTQVEAVLRRDIRDLVDFKNDTLMDKMTSEEGAVDSANERRDLILLGVGAALGLLAGVLI